MNKDTVHCGNPAQKKYMEDMFWDVCKPLWGKKAPEQENLRRKEGA
jgi:hypothetical protein